MKKTIGVFLALVLTGISPLMAADDHKDHDHKEHAGEGKKKAGPNNGRVVTSGDLKFEVLVEKDRKLRITFLDKEGKAVALKDQTATATGGDRAAPVKLAFAADGGSLLSDKAFPEGNSLPIVIQVKETADAKSVTEKFNVNLAPCPNCKLGEYACICDDTH